jgi:hypothetical protein
MQWIETSPGLGLNIDPTSRKNSLSHSEAMIIFQPNHDVLLISCLQNIRQVMTEEKAYMKPNSKLLVDEIFNDMQRLKITTRIAGYKKTADRITMSKRVLTPQQKAGQITDIDIQAARDVPMDQLYTDKLFGKEDGRRFGRCPFHTERTPSFCIDRKNRWYCHGACKIGGDTIDYVMKEEGVDFIPAVKLLINR